MQRITNIEKIDSGSNYNFPDKLERPNNPRSLFNLSHLVTMTISNGGLIFPIYLDQEKKPLNLAR